jgi:hypothetical protein
MSTVAAASGEEDTVHKRLFDVQCCIAGSQERPLLANTAAQVCLPHRVLPKCFCKRVVGLVETGGSPSVGEGCIECVRSLVPQRRCTLGGKEAVPIDVRDAGRHCGRDTGHAHGCVDAERVAVVLEAHLALLWHPMKVGLDGTVAAAVVTVAHATEAADLYEQHRNGLQQRFTVPQKRSSCFCQLPITTIFTPCQPCSIVNESMACKAIYKDALRCADCGKALQHCEECTFSTYWVCACTLWKDGRDDHMRDAWQSSPHPVRDVQHDARFQRVKPFPNTDRLVLNSDIP